MNKINREQERGDVIKMKIDEKQKIIRRILNGKARISCLEILILIVAGFAVPYIISSDIEGVSGQEDSTFCCEKTKDGKICQDSSPNECDNNFKMAPTKCELSSFCEIGCCSSSENGLCTRRSPKGECLIKNGTYSPDPSCNIQQCNKGCCIIGNEAKWTTERNCKFIGNSENKDIPTEWLFDEKTNSELKCIFSTRKGQEGACVYMSGEEKKCVYTTLDECIARTGDESNFAHNKTFCSDPILNTTCKARDRKGCLDGKEDVYWFDSCGNHEDIAINCDFSKGNYCGKENSEYKCKDVNCVVDGKRRKNGESWCEYDGSIGVNPGANAKDKYGRDPVGSRHVKRICYMGTERVEPCSDYRNEICVQSDSLTKGGESFSQANCRVNNWRKCLEINSKKQNTEDMKKNCEKNPDCFLKEIDMDGSFHFFVCLPSYPPGFSLDDNYTLMNGMEVPSSSDAICSIATQRCTETWICGIFGCYCVDNCKCHTPYFTEKMNEFCISLGDCGSYINYIGTFSNAGYGTRANCAPGTCRKGPERFSKDPGYSKNALPNPGQPPAKPGEFEFYETLNPDVLREAALSADNSNTSAFQRELLEVAGAMGSPYLLEIVTEGENITLEEERLGNINSRPINFAGFFNGFSAVKSSISSQMMKKDIKAGGFEMIGAMVAALIAYIITQSILMTLLVALFTYLLFLAWIVYVDIDFFCDSWERPDGGADCNKCNTKEVPCSEYRCRSLGQQCIFANKGGTNELCVSRPENSSLPKITPLYSVLTKGYSYYNVNENGYEVVNSKDNGCVEAYSVVRIGIGVEPFARCKFGSDPNGKYDEMPEEFGIKGNNVLPVHQMDLFFPSPEAFKNIYNITDEKIKELGKIDLYVRCKTANGKINPEAYHIKSCIKPGPDLTSPMILLTDPLKDSYIKYNIDSEEIKMYVNEPSECKWSKEDRESFESMENSFSCEKDPRNYTMFGLKCRATLSGLKNNTKFYFKCRDTSENKNIMKENYEYSLRVSNSPLVIEDMKPYDREEVIANTEPVSFKLRLKTSGGAEKGVSTCSWNGNGYSDMFTETNSTLHSYYITSAMKGKYKINFECEDIAGNKAQNSSSFFVSVDRQGPEIIRVYYDGGLKIVTDSDSECKYSFNRIFDFENATSMSGKGAEHYTMWEPKTYYIQCKDWLGNKGGKISVKPYDIYGGY